jgi:hypothetical protein
MIRLRHLPLPSGLIVVVRKDTDGGLQVFVSDALAADRQRSAVRLALRSIRRTGWRAGLVPLPVGILLAAFRRSILPVTRAVRSHAIASSAAALVLAAGAAALIVGLPHHHEPAMAGQQPGRSQVHAPATGRTHVARDRGTGHNPVPTPGAIALAHPSASAPAGPVTTPGAPQSAAPSASQPAPAKPSKPAVPPPSGTPSPTQTAAPSPSPSPAPSGHAACLVVLGIWVCL